MKDYDDIIHLPHHVSKKHPPMSAINRAAQFSPFAALTGYDVAIQESVRRTNRRIELDDFSQDMLNQKLAFLSEIIHEHPAVAVTHFVPDKRKEGGAYVTSTALLKKIDFAGQTLHLSDGSAIPLANISDIESERFGAVL